jgi:hypothetical protein
VTELFTVHAAIMQIEKSDESEKEKNNAVHRAVSAMVNHMPWATGDAGKQLVAGTPLAAADEAGAELRDDEMQGLSGDQLSVTIKQIGEKKFPEPRKPGAEAAVDSVV